MKTITLFSLLFVLSGCNAQVESPQFNTSPVPAGWTGTPTKEQKEKTFQGREVPEFPTMSEVLENEKK